MGIYQESGYINYEWMKQQGCTLICIVAPRGTGKTFTILDYYLQKKEPIIYGRRTKMQMITAADNVTSIYKPLNIERGYNVRGEFCKDSYAKFWEEDEEHGERLVAFGAPLNTFYNVRGFSAAEFNDLFFDEAVPEPTEPQRGGEEKAFLNMIETINRNRELSGGKPINITIAGNSDTLNVPIFRALDLVKIIENLVRTGQEMYIDKKESIAVFNLVNSPIAAKKKETFLYKRTKNKSFVDMAINNKFRDLDASETSIKTSVPLVEYIPLYSIDGGEIYVYKHKSRGEYYFTTKKTGAFNKNYNLYLTSERKEFILKEKKTLIMIIERKAFFESFDIKAKLENVLFNSH